MKYNHIDPLISSLPLVLLHVLGELQDGAEHAGALPALETLGLGLGLGGGGHGGPGGFLLDGEDGGELGEGTRQLGLGFSRVTGGSWSLLLLIFR